MKASDAIERSIREKEELARLCYIDGDFIVFDAQGTKYEISFSECASYPAILKWVYHLSQKSWITLPVLLRFVYLACEHHGLPL
jgi:hypothetical protein